ncbi:MAG: glycosyltransferase family 4 protein [Chloroflexota bacterium]
MRILFLTNYYPPCQYDWGYMQLCEEAAESMAARGHDVAVLTSHYRHGAEWKRPYPVYRLLPIDPDWRSGESAFKQFFFGRRAKEQQSVAHLKQVVEAFQPDIIFAWHCIGLSRRMLQTAETFPGIVMAYYFANYMPELADEHLLYWRAPAAGFPTRLIKRMLSQVAITILAREGKPIRLRYENSACVSDYVRQRLAGQGLIPENSAVIHNGIDLNIFSQPGRATFSPQKTPIRCLVAGRVDAEKGVHTVVEAFVHLQTQGLAQQFQLTILGDGLPAYTQALRNRVKENNLERIIEFRPPVPRHQMPQILAGYHILILASEYAEPLARAGQEAMGMGLLVIGTTTGGSSELLIHKKTGLAFAAGNAGDLAAQLAAVWQQPEMATNLAAAGQHTVIQHFNMVRMGDEIESFLQNLRVTAV